MQDTLLHWIPTVVGWAAIVWILGRGILLLRSRAKGVSRSSWTIACRCIAIAGAAVIAVTFIIVEQVHSGAWKTVLAAILLLLAALEIGAEILEHKSRRSSNGFIATPLPSLLKDLEGVAVESGDLEITFATYGVPGVPGKETDVKDRLTGLIVDDVLDFFANNETLGVDPAQDEFKTLRIRWTYQGKPDASSYYEGTHIVIPREAARRPETDDANAITTSIGSTDPKPTTNLQDAARVVRSELRSIAQTAEQYITALEKIGPGRTIHYSTGFRFARQAWDQHCTTLAANDPLFSAVEPAYSEVDRVNTVIAWRETGAKGLFGVNREEDDLPRIQSRANEAITALDAFLNPHVAETPESREREVDGLLRSVEAARASVVLRGHRGRPVGLGSFSVSIDTLVIADAHGYIGRYGTPDDGDHLRELEGEYRGMRTPEARVRRLDALAQVLADMKARGAP